ncbi:MAG: ComF family protein [Fimbriimonadales bacterium]|nr:ComF family protein [Fimbriimonadales bacterium]MDW8051429.1 ComF family protein [Armatimonadota bacterium]
MRWLLDALYPRRCVACGRFCAEPVCEGCRATWRLILPPACLRCGAPLRALGECRYCLGRAYAFDRAVCASVYADSVRCALLNLKFRRWKRAAEPLAHLLWQALQQAGEDELGADGIVPVPIHRLRRAWRGFNQAELLARALSLLSGVPVWAGVLRRRFYQRPQVGLSQTERAQNVHGAFEVVCPEQVRNRVVWLLDDVFTTGSTLDACATVLKEAGAACVVALAVARDLAEVGE